MTTDTVPRRLLAIMAADVVGFSQLMESDEVGTLVALKALRKDTLQPLVTRYQGRVFKVAGDAVLIEFASPVNAVQCAIDLQDGLAAAASEAPGDRRISLRIGINLGDVMVEGGDLYGDGVNIAARLESLADPGGILISESVHGHVTKKVGARFTDLGPQNLKNIAKPIRVYKISDVASSSTRSDPSTKPSIAVLPFTNLNADRDQQYLSDGITEDLLTELSRYPELLVIARNSSFQYRDMSVDMKRVGRELGVSYLVEGSLRKAGNRLRITAQLIEAATGAHLWAERYDRDLQDIFAIQDEVTQSIAASLVGQLGRSGAKRIRQKPTASWAAYDYYLQAMDHLSRWEEDAAMPLLRQAIQLDPDFALAYAQLSECFMVKFAFDTQDAFIEESLALAKKALTLDENNGTCQEAMGMAQLYLGQLDIAEAYLARAIALNGNSVHHAAQYAWYLRHEGRVDEALGLLDAVVQRDPLIPEWHRQYRGYTLLTGRRYEEAIQVLLPVNPKNYYDHSSLAAAYAYLGREVEARIEAANVLALCPDFSKISWPKALPYRNAADLEHELDGFRRAGLIA